MERRKIMFKNTIKSLIEEFKVPIHYEEIIPLDISKPIKIKIKSCLSLEDANKIINRIVPIYVEPKYKQDKRIKKQKIIIRYESEKNEAY